MNLFDQELAIKGNRLKIGENIVDLIKLNQSFKFWVGGNPSYINRLIWILESNI